MLARYRITSELRYGPLALSLLLSVSLSHTHTHIRVSGDEPCGLCQDPDYENLVSWTSDYVNYVASTSSTGGTSTLDNASAACTFFMIGAGMQNPFHHSEVRHTRQSWARMKSHVGEVKAKAGERKGRVRHCVLSQRPSPLPLLCRGPFTHGGKRAHCSRCQIGP